jgi:hypothetical protein
VRLAEGFVLPSYAPEAMEKKVLDQLGRAALPDSCTPPKIADRQPVRLSDDGSLSGVMLAASKFSRQQSRPPMTHEVSIRDCRLRPSLVVAMKGDRLRVRNEVDYAFMPGLGDEPMVRTLSAGQTYDVDLTTPGVSALSCGFTAPCGRTDVIVMQHPYYAVTDQTGRFRFESFPTGEPVTVSAWHPLFQESRIELQLEPGEQKQIELVLTPQPQAGSSPSASPPPAPPAKKTPLR